MFDVMLLLVEVVFEWVVVGVQTHFHAKPNSVELSSDSKGGGVRQCSTKAKIFHFFLFPILRT